jgi:hypothetical protein
MRPGWGACLLLQTSHDDDDDDTASLRTSYLNPMAPLTSSTKANVMDLLRKSIFEY